MSLQHILTIVTSAWIVIYLGYPVVAATKETIFTYRSAESKLDVRYNYDTSLLQLALENTLDTDGPYKLIPSPLMNFARAHAYIQENSLPNFFVKLSYELDFQNRNMAFVPFPVDLGIVGYRVCFAHPEVVDQLSQVQSLEDLRRFTHGQGSGWSDVKILRHNGFNVTVAPSYQSLFRMVALRRFDLFCRGTNELLDELTSHQHIQNLSYDSSFTIAYPLPRFFYTNAANSDALDRIRRGILIAYNNGSLQALWRKQYQKSVDFARLSSRRVFTLENPLTDGLNFNYKQYFYNPFTSTP